MKTKTAHPEAPAFTDLTLITREPKRCQTRVILHMDWGTQVPWLQFGQGSLLANDRGDQWRLEARMEATDQEHDAALALRLPLIGVRFIWVHHHTTQVSAWVDPNAVDEFSQDFRVPTPGYDPTKHPQATKCTRCKGAEAHVIVPGGFYVPPFDPDLYQKVRGKRVDIYFQTLPGKVTK